MKTLILYYSSHHGNTKKLVDAIVAQGNVTAVDVSATTVTDCSDYDMIGFASGIYYQKFHESILKWAAANLPQNKKVFFLYTCGVKRKSYADAICYTKKVHEQRYRCYLAGETKESRAYTETIKKIIPELIKCAQKMNELDIFNKKQKQQIKEGKKELQYLLTHFASQKRTLY